MSQIRFFQISCSFTQHVMPPIFSFNYWVNTFFLIFSAKFPYLMWLDEESRRVGGQVRGGQGVVTL